MTVLCADYTDWQHASVWLRLEAVWSWEIAYGARSLKATYTHSFIFLKPSFLSVSLFSAFEYERAESMTVSILILCDFVYFFGTSCV